MTQRPENRKPSDVTRRMSPHEKRRNPNLGRVDRYILLEHLGTGGFGAVYRGRDQVTEIEVALKLVPSYLSDNPDELENIRENFRLVAKLRHPNIANVQHLHTIEYVDPVAETAVGVAPGDCFIVMDYIAGQTVSSYRHEFADSTIPFEEALRIVAQVAEGLDFAHSQNVIHRDIKPGNVIVTRGGEVKILDFGLAAQIRASMVSVSGEIGNTSGTPPYMPPEQWRGRSQGPRADQYSLAVLFYEMVAGQVPFSSAFESSDHTMMYNVVRNEPPPPVAKLSRRQNRALVRALAKTPVDRFDSCAGFIRALGGRKFLRECRFRSMRATGPQEKAQKPSPSSPALVWTLIGLVLFTLLAWGGLKAHEHYLEMQEQEARTTHATQMDKLRRQHVDVLLGEASEALEEENNEAAVKALDRLKQIAPDHAEVQALEEEIGATISLSTIIPLRSEANMKWNRVEVIDPGQGIGELINRGQAVLAAANMLYEAREYRQARDRYRQLIEDYEQLQGLVTRREKAEQQAQSAKRSQTQAKRAQAEKHAPEIMRGARELTDSAKKAFSAGEFREANKLWTTATAEYAKATAMAKGIIAVRKTRESYEKALHNIEQPLLDKHGGPLWEEIQRNIERAERLADVNEWERAARLWDEARKMLPRAAAEARVLKNTPAETSVGEQIPEALREARTARAIAEADAAKAQGDWQSTLHYAREALRYDPDSDHARELRREAVDHVEPKLEIIAAIDGREIPGAQVDVEGVLEDAATPVTVRLKKGRKYNITVTLDPQRTEERYAPFEIEYEAHDTGLKVLRAELPEAPVPPDVIVIEDTEYADIEQLAEGSRNALQKQKEAVEKDLFLPLEVKPSNVEINMRLIPAGTLTRNVPAEVAFGYEPEATGDAPPVTTSVEIAIPSAFYVARHEITRGQWKAVMGKLPDEDQEQKAELDIPVTGITWSQAVEFCAVLNKMQGVPEGTYRLPYESEWEYVCRAGTSSPWYTGATLEAAHTAGWYDVNSNGHIHSVGQRLPNAWGIYDGHGNAWEWCLDPYTPQMLELPETAAEEENSTSFRVIRGGGFDSAVETSRAMHRAKNRKSNARSNLGFRIIRELDF